MAYWEVETTASLDLLGRYTPVSLLSNRFGFESKPNHKQNNRVSLAHEAIKMLAS